MVRNERMKLLIAIPTVDYMHRDFVSSLLALTGRLHSEGVDFAVRMQGDTLVYLGRDQLAMHAVSNGFTTVLWLDSDMVFGQDLMELLTQSGEEFVTAIAVGRRPPHRSCLFSSLDPPERVTDYPGELFEVEACGFGCVLIETHILAECLVQYQTCFFPERTLGEDLSFCRRAREMGYRIHAEPRAVIGHIGHKAIYPEGRT